MKFSELTRLDEIGVRSLLGSADADFSDVCYDSRRVKKNALFVAISGFASDGHEFIDQAIANGANIVVLQDATRLNEEDATRLGVTKIVVENSRRALAIICEEFFGSPSKKLRLIGVTGTNGKTTVTNVLKQLLESKQEKVGLIGTIGIMIGQTQLEATHTTPESREISELLGRMVMEGVTTCVMEVSSHALVLGRVAALDFDIAVFTNLTQDHLDFHKTMEQYLAAKRILFTGLKDTAVAITNADDQYGESIVANTLANVHTYGIRSDDGSAPHSDLFAQHVELTMHGTRLEIQKRYSDERALIHTSLVGGFNVENILASTAALYFGVSGFSLANIATAFQSVTPVRGRFEAIRLPNNATAIIDYAHTPDALQHVLETIIEMNDGLSAESHPKSTKIITVFGCGGDRDKGKRPQMGKIAAMHSDKIFITNDNPRSELPEAIAREILEGIGVGARAKVEIVLDRSKAIALALSESKEGDTVLIAGKGHETYQIFGSERHHFDDREEVIQWAQSQ